MKKIAFRCDADPVIGYGHLQRCIGLAKVLTNEFGFGVTFYTIKSNEAISLLELNNLNYVLLDNSSFYTFSNLLIKSLAEILIIDERRYLSTSDIDFIKDKKITTVLIDDLSDKRLAADYVFYPPIGQYSKLNWEGFVGQRYSGWDWVLLKPEYAHLMGKKNKNERRILVTFGGSDYWALTETLIKWLDQVDGEFEVDLVITKAFKNYVFLKDIVTKAPLRYKLNIHDSPKSIRSLMSQVDFAIATFGVTAYELAATGVASILLCPTNDHFESAKIFEANDISTIYNITDFLPLNDDSLFRKSFLKTISFFLNNRELVMEMGVRARSICRGDGAYNIAKKIQTFT